MNARLLPFFALLLLTQCAPQAPYSQGMAQQAAPPAAYSPPQIQAAPPPPSQPGTSPGPLASSWQRTSAVRSQNLAGGAVLHEFTTRSAAESAEVSVIVFDSQRCALRVLDQPSPQAGSGVLTPLMRGAGAIAGVNGGFFHPDFSTLGLMIADGRKAGQFAKTSLVSGSVVMIGQEPYLVWNHEFLGERGVTQMVQAGPRLVDAGQPLPTLNRSKNATRTFIATDGKRQWAIGTVRSTTLAGLGELLASPGVLPDIQVKRALNLDGGRSTALYARPAGGQEISRPGWSTVRNYLAVVPR
ncbi:phosphodiester glycosidase family protein [Prosthecobacter sp. SYSU 5D2]|uniref:phosphodiester glycosidase family protein n=1 Tax=Prosthecobacter sp. SYSU 5D2 TaxID=3134134 RepID=UPI0031FE643A